MFETLWQDLRHGVRMLTKNPGFAVVAMISIGIGVGANTAMFSVADGLVLRPLPVPRPGEVVTIRTSSPNAGLAETRVSYPDYVDVRDQSHSFAGLVAYAFVITSFANRPDEPAQRKVGMAVSSNLFDAMKVGPGLGRAFRPEEDLVAGRDAVVVLDHDEWTERFAADPAIVDRRIRIGGVEFTVIGVAPPGFSGIDHDVHPAFYVPLAMLPTVQSGTPANEWTRRDARGLVVKGRLAPGVTLAQARVDVQQIAVNLARAYPESNRDRGLSVRTELDAYGARPGSDLNIVTMLLVLALVVLLVACANVAGLLASRAPARALEVSLRLAIGASRTRIVRQLVTESLLIAIGGAVLGLAAGYGAVEAFRRLEFPTDIPLKLTFALDARALFVGIGVAATGAILASLVPAWQATRTDLVSGLRDSSATIARRSRLWGRGTLVCGQVALSLVLLTVSVFLYRAFQAELGRGPGFRTDHVLMMSFDPGLARYDEPRTREFYRLLKDRARAIPGVMSVALTSSVPMKTDTLERTAVAPEGFQLPPGTDNVSVWAARVDEDYLDTLGIPIVRGRGVRPTDTAESPRVAVVGETLAAHYWPGQTAIGKRIRLDEQGRVFAEIVGVAADVRNVFIAFPLGELLYLPDTQVSTPRRTLLVHSEGEAAALAAPLREAVRAIDPNMPIFGVRTMEDFYFSRAIHTTNLIVGSVSGMGSMGLALAVVGLYGLVAYAATRRTREIGVRMALGASAASVRWMVLRNGLWLTMAGVALGLVASVATGGLLRGAFPGAGRIDLATFLIVVPLLVAVTLVAAYVPARRAARMDPLAALRQE